MRKRNTVPELEDRVAILKTRIVWNETEPVNFSPQPEEVSGRSLWLLGILLVFAVVVRMIATRNDLWLDEVISLRTAQAIKTPWQIFSAIHSDNNHYLTTLYLYLFRNQNSTLLYRLFSVICGVALVPAGYWLLAKRSRLEATIFAGMLACSYPLIHFSSEARGYTGAVLGCVLACGALTRWIDEKNKRHRSGFGLLYGIALTFALLSHLTACLIWIALALGSFVIVLEQGQRAKQISRWLALNALPGTVLGCLYFLDLRFVNELGGAPMSVGHGLSRLLALGLGWPAKDAVSVWLVVTPLMWLVGRRLIDERRAGDSLPFLLALIYLIPLACVLAMRPFFFAARYFLVTLPFVYVPLAMLLAQAGRVRVGKKMVAGALALFAVGQMYTYARFLQVGRGQYTAAMQYVLAHTEPPRIVVTSNQDFRARVELAYFGHVAGKRELDYAYEGSSTSVRPDWYILHAEGEDAPGPEVLEESGEKWYRAAYFGASELSGQAWTIYSSQPRR